jgi:2-polyprenyl-3-methyl-5-hydroxy-6-metoxy-1,4-benzoquinol methylase
MAEPVPFLLKRCCLCGSPSLPYAFEVQGQRLCQCEGCSLLFFNPQPSDEALEAIYTQGYFLGSEEPGGREQVAAMKEATARLYLAQLLDYHGSARGRLLEVGCGRGEFLGVAAEAGFEVSGVDVSPSSVASANQRFGREAVLCGNLEDVPLQAGSYDVCALFDAIEHVRDPSALLQRLHGLLKPGGTLFLSTPSLDSWNAKLLKQHWMEFKTEHLFYFDGQTMQGLLAKGGFEQVEVTATQKVLSLAYVNSHFERFKVPLFTPLLALLKALSPRALHELPVKIPASGMNVLSRAAIKRPTPLLSVVVPVYNEAGTFPRLIEALQDKQLAGVDKEIILVESHSTDGTREQVLAFQGRPGFKVVLQEKARGKGNAVRAGLEVAQGDFVIIQDGDLEYDINDYDLLLEPLLCYRRGVVLGSRHSRSWKIRDYKGQPLVTLLLNGAHIFFATMINWTCGADLRDPFTMYKVFRRDCLHGLRFKSNRFDFDFELIMKLLRKGYKPLELPINYRARSFQEGKKVRMIRDPLTWLVALVRFRLCKLYEKP